MSGISSRWTPSSQRPADRKQSQVMLSHSDVLIDVIWQATQPQDSLATSSVAG